VDFLYKFWTIYKLIEVRFTENEKLLSFYRCRELLTVLDGMLVSDDRVVLSRIICPAVLETLHLAHFDIRRIIQLIRRYFYWPAMHNDIERFIKNCNHCIQIAAAPREESLHP